ncbi:GntR family transcriptional regulator [Thioclava pacifica]|uniref:HTH gntR-type domain-containing protein n=1 Tax=Thioclava pacifica DSM 10166 TaxID=1353537 RepID=A0A074K1F6_9RHOB|nr:GntR family transcriptional regulator [Thioclava pacifica]KEO55427.1 hypothetical protein TP2_15410 [Thioclava pacifica DSM 10166]
MAKPRAPELYKRLRAEIVLGRLAPSQRLRLEDLRTRTGSSVPTLREVLTRLSADGFVIAEDQKGFMVAPISVENLRELADLRKLVEMEALARSIEAGDMEWESRVVAAHYKLSRSEARMQAGEAAARDDWKRYDWEFHQTLISACGSRELLSVHAMVFDKYLRYQMLFLTFRGGIAQAEHQALREAALDRDVASAQAILSKHIEGGVAHALAAYADRERAG